MGVHMGFQLADRKKECLCQASATTLISISGVRTGSAGAAGATGATGPRGPSDGFFMASGYTNIARSPDWSTVAYVVLPPGKYIATATAYVYNWTTQESSMRVTCRFPAEIEVDREVGFWLRDGSNIVGRPAAQALPITAAINLSGASGSTTVSMQCQHVSGSYTVANAENASISAVQVENLVKPAG